MINENQPMDDIREFNTNIVAVIEQLFNITCFCETDLTTKMTLKTPGRTFTKLRAFKFNFNYLFTLSSKRSEIDEKLKKNVRMWLDMTIPFKSDGEIELDYIRAGKELFSQYGDELCSAGLIVYKR